MYFLRQPTLPGPPTGPEPCDASWCGRCTRWQVVYIQTVFFVGLVVGLRFAQPEALRRHLLRAVAAAVISSRSPRHFGLVSRHKPVEHRIPDVPAAPDVEASRITCCRGSCVFFSERRCGVTICLQLRRRQHVQRGVQALRRARSWGTRVVGKLACGRA